ncbi:MAG: T9SS type A sorting domain-containing protein [Bacteroidia bacterium]|nr:T9SS type A sorting domain-containing protein [Bacteroidia bacterium]
MMKRTILHTVLLLAVLFPPLMFAQGQGGDDAVMGLPVISVRLESSATQLFYVDYDYVPNRITVTAWVKNISADTAIARNVNARIIADTRFNVPVGEPVEKHVADFLNPGDSASVTYELVVASERSDDGTDDVRVLVFTDNAYAKDATIPIWVQREMFPILQNTIGSLPSLVFDDNTNDFIPNPFCVDVVVRNTGEGVADSVYIQFVGVRYVTVFEQDSSIKYLGAMRPNEERTVRFCFRPAWRTFDTTVTLKFQTHGIGGYKRKKYIQADSVSMFLPAAKQAAYQVVCNIVPSFIEFKDHRYNPDPFDYTVQITNVGTAVGKGVKAKLQFTGFTLNSGESEEKDLGDIGLGQTVNVSWKLKPTRLFERDTLFICVRVYDIFNNNAVCCDSVIVDSIRTARFDVACTGPDTIRADNQAGVYLNNPFDVEFTVCNIGSDYADSLKATIFIQSPNVTPIPGFPNVIEKAIVSGTDSLGVDSCYTFRWTLEALPMAVTTPVRIKFTAQALNAEPRECEIVVIVQRLDAPNLDITCGTIPEDTVNFDPSSGGYFPPYIIYWAVVKNIGGGIAKNVSVTLAPPPRTQLADGETWTKLANPKDLGPNDSARIEWITVPVRRTDFGSNITYRAEVTSENVVERPVCSADVFVPALPKTAAFSIPSNNVGYTNQLIMVPIFIDDPTDKDIKKIEIKLHYNIDDNRNRRPLDVVEFLEIVQFNSLTEGWNILNQGRNASNDVLQFTIQSTSQLAYPDNVAPEFIPPLIWLKFRAAFGSSPDDLDIERTPVLWPDPLVIQSEVVINDGSIFPLVTPGEVWVSGDCLRPLTASPDYIIFNRPNPFNPSTTFEYHIPVDEHVKIVVFDALGREVRTLVNDYRTAGYHSLVFNADGLPSGIYFYRLETPSFSTMKKMVISK